MIRQDMNPKTLRSFVAMFRGQARSARALALWDTIASQTAGGPCEFWVSLDDALYIIAPQNPATVRALNAAATAFLTLLPLIPEDAIPEVITVS